MKRFLQVLLYPYNAVCCRNDYYVFLRASVNIVQHSVEILPSMYQLHFLNWLACFKPRNSFFCRQRRVPQNIGEILDQGNEALIRAVEGYRPVRLENKHFLAVNDSNLGGRHVFYMFQVSETHPFFCFRSCSRFDLCYYSNIQFLAGISEEKTDPSHLRHF